MARQVTSFTNWSRGPVSATGSNRSGKFSEDEAIRVITQLTQALHNAHERRIIHRDVKPDNILLIGERQDQADRLWAGQGLQQLPGHHASVERVGTPHFMAPEQFADAKTVDARCDIYSVAATLYNLLTGTLPFDAKGVAGILTNKELMRLPSLRTLSPEVSEAMDSAVMAAAEPEARPPTRLVPGAFQPADDSSARDGHAQPDARSTADGHERRSHRFSLRVGCCAVVDPNLHGGGEEKWPLLIRDLSASGIGMRLADG